MSSSFQHLFKEYTQEKESGRLDEFKNINTTPEKFLKGYSLYREIRMDVGGSSFASDGIPYRINFKKSYEGEKYQLICFASLRNEEEEYFFLIDISKKRFVMAKCITPGEDEETCYDPDYIFVIFGTFIQQRPHSFLF